MRYFTVTLEAYEETNSALDAVFGHPNGKAETTLNPNPLLASSGLALIAVPDSITEWPEVLPLIDTLLDSGAAAEISKEEYEASLPAGGIEI